MYRLLLSIVMSFYQNNKKIELKIEKKFQDEKFEWFSANIWALYIIKKDLHTVQVTVSVIKREEID